MFNKQTTINFINSTPQRVDIVSHFYPESEKSITTPKMGGIMVTLKGSLEINIHRKDAKVAKDNQLIGIT